jgi:hypothetical protein
LAYFCGKLARTIYGDGWEVLDRSGHSPLQLVDLVRDLAQCDLTYTWGGRATMGKFLWAARLLQKKKMVILWSGSDVLFAQKQLAGGLPVSWIADKVHWANAPWIAEEVRAMGLTCEYVPQVHFIKTVERPKPLPSKFSVLLFMANAERTALYGWDRMVEAASSLPQVEFNLCGLPQGQTLRGPQNIKVHNWTSDLTPLLEQSTVVYRPVRHDGLSFTVLEALSHGRHVVWTYPLTGCIQATSAADASVELARLLAAHESGTLTLNQVGRNYIATHHSFEVARSELLRRWEEIILS